MSAEHLTLQQLLSAAVRGQEAISRCPDPGSVHALQAQAWLQGVEALSRFLQDPADVQTEQMRMFLDITSKYAAVFPEPEEIPDILNRPALAQCNRCGRFTWSPSEVRTTDLMTQPDSRPCGGFMEALK